MFPFSRALLELAVLGTKERIVAPPPTPPRTNFAAPAFPDQVGVLQWGWEEGDPSRSGERAQCLPAATPGGEPGCHSLDVLWPKWLPWGGGRNWNNGPQTPARPRCRAGREDWELCMSRAFLEQKQEEETWPQPRDHKDQAGRLIKPRAGQRHLSPLLG